MSSNTDLSHSEDDVSMPEAAAAADHGAVGWSSRAKRRKCHTVETEYSDGNDDEIAVFLPFSKHSRLDEEGGNTNSLPTAPSLEAFLKEPEAYRPQDEWLQVSTEGSTTLHFRLVQRLSQVDSSTVPALPLAKVSFGADRDSALHQCIRSGNYESAKRLIQEGAVVNVENIKGVSPIIMAAQIGRLDLVQLLERAGANESHVTLSGSTAALQAAHFGRLAVLRHLLQKNRQLLETANYRHTTPLMRASQEGHLDVVKFLCELGAMVNRKNMQGMTALMLASQRGNAQVCEYLIQEGADLNAMTQQASTSLVLACKRQHVETVQVLVRAGAELCVKDARGRTARDIVLHRFNSHRHHNNEMNNDAIDDETSSSPLEVIQKLTSLLDSTVQVDLMRLQARKDRSWAWIRTWNLLQQDRARIRGAEDIPLHAGAVKLAEQRRSHSVSTLAWIRTFALPAPLVCLIADFAPVPSILDRRVTLLIHRCSVDPNSALASCFDLIDEVLEESGFLEACDQALVPPPDNFYSWASWRGCRLRNARMGASSEDAITQGPREQTIRPNSTLVQVGRPQDPGALVQHRRYAGYLQLLSKHLDSLAPVLSSPPYDLEPIVVHQLVTCSDICSVIRRLGSHQGCGGFSTGVAMDVILFASRLCGCYVGDA